MRDLRSTGHEGEQSDRLYGRDDLMRVLTEVVTGISARRAVGGALLVGEAGMGKSALLDASVAAAGDCRVFRAQGLPLESQRPFAGVHQVLAPLRGSLADLPDHAREVLEAVLTMSGERTLDEFEVGAGLLSLLGDHSRSEPVLMVVDDAHWLDLASLGALLFAFARLSEEGVGLLMASRPHPAVDTVRIRGLREIHLEPLDPRATSEFAASVAPGLDPVALDTIVRLSAGVPLAIVELAAREPLDGGLAALERSDDGLVDRLFGDRVERLSPPALTAAVLAALDEPSELDAYVCAGEQLGAGPDAWVEAEAAGVLRSGDGRIDFRHPLLRDAVLRVGGPARVRTAHRALADVLRDRGDLDRGAQHQAEGTLGTNDQLADLLEQCADNLRRRSGHRQAAVAFAQSARLSATADARARRLLSAGDSARRGGQPEWARALAQEARQATAERTIHVRAEMLHAHVEARHGSMTEALRAYRRVAALAESDGDGAELRAIALSYASSAAIVVGDVSGAVAAGREAERLCARGVPEDAVIAVRETLAVALALSGETDLARPRLAELASSYERRDDRVGAEFVAEALIWLGEHSRARALLDDVVAAARRLGAPALLVQSLVLRADLGYRTGEWPAALADAGEAVRLAEDTRQPVPLAYALAALALLQAATGVSDRARDHAERARHAARAHGLGVVEETAAWALGMIELTAGDPGAALAQFEPLAAAAIAGGRGEPAVALWPADHIEALLTAGRTADAAVALERLHEQASRTGGAWASGVEARYRAALVAESERDALFAQALEDHARSGMPFEHARTQLRYGQWLRRAGRRIDSRVQLRAALTTFEQLRAVPLRDLALRELAGTGEHLRRDGGTRDELTPQEAQIASFVASGATNREAAVSLFLSEKTIETHLTRVYRKLGIRSRSQLALALEAIRSPVATVPPSVPT